MALPPPKKVDQVFQLSLTELAFVLIFLLLLMAGAVVVGLERQVAEAKEHVETVNEKAESAKRDKEATEAAYERLEKIFQHHQVENPEKAITELIERTAKEKESERLRERIENLEAQISALEEIEKIIRDSHPEKARETVEEAIESALAFKKAMEKETGNKIEPGKEKKVARELIEPIKDVQNSGVDPQDLPGIMNQIKNLQGQNKWLTKKLNSQGGRDYPPCWTDKNGNIQYLFRVEIRDKGLVLEKAWPTEREAEALSIPNLNEILSGETQTLPVFRNNMQNIFEKCVSKECRHYVILDNEVDDLNTFNRYRYGVESFFYKYEVRE